ncbi:MAG: phage holin family protein [Deltaproteobacteria bacterium]|nr:phage holin family protein [Deltaproteobacteria bacterium]
MPGLLIRWFTTAFALWLTSQLISGIYASGVMPLFFAAVVLGLLNAMVRPVVLLLTLPINILTLGLFTFVINGFMLKLTGSLVPGFQVRGFWAAVFGALLLSVFSFLINVFISDSGHVEYIYIQRIEKGP